MSETYDKIKPAINLFISVFFLKLWERKGVKFPLRPLSLIRAITLLSNISSLPPSFKPAFQSPSFPPPFLPPKFPSPPPPLPVQQSSFLCGRGRHLLALLLMQGPTHLEAGLGAKLGPLALGTVLQGVGHGADATERRQPQRLWVNGGCSAPER